MTTPPPEQGLREFLRPIARNKWILLLVMLAAIGGAIVYSISQRNVYRTTATIGFQSSTPELAVTGIYVASSLTPEQIALVGMHVVRSPPVTARVRQLLGSGASEPGLFDTVSANVDAVSDVVNITAQASSAQAAQRSANAFANATVTVINEQSRASYAGQAVRLRKNEHSISAPERSAYAEQLNRVQTLSAISAPARVIASALAPQAPISPTPIANALVAGLLALVLGLSFALLRESLDHRVHSTGDIETEIPLPVIGRLHHGALGSHPGELDPTDREQIRIISRNLHFLDVENRLSSIAVASAVPGEGKTTVALFVALASAATGRRTLLLECDLRRPVIDERVPGIERSPGVTDVVTGHAEVGEVVQSAQLPGRRRNGAIDPTNGLACITAGSPTQYPAEVLGSARFGAMLDQLRQAYEMVVLDTPPLLPFVDARELLPRIEAVILCVREQWTTRDQVRAGRVEIERLQHQLLGLVVTGTSDVDDQAYRAYADAGASVRSR